MTPLRSLPGRPAHPFVANEHEHLASHNLVASCVAFRGSSSPRHPEAGQLSWLVTDPAHTCKGLGMIVAASVTNRLAANGFRRPYLGTEDFRIAAVSIYLTLGWRPFIYRDDMHARWRAIFARLGRKVEGLEPATDLIDTLDIKGRPEYNGTGEMTRWVPRIPQPP